jgi:hypothetical protein
MLLLGEQTYTRTDTALRSLFEGGALREISTRTLTQGEQVEQEKNFSNITSLQTLLHH